MHPSLLLSRLSKRDLEYAALEDEFRMGLQIEANRFREVSTADIVLTCEQAHVLGPMCVRAWRLGRERGEVTCGPFLERPDRLLGP